MPGRGWELAALETPTWSMSISSPDAERFLQSLNAQRIKAVYMIAEDASIGYMLTWADATSEPKGEMSKVLIFARLPRLIFT